MWFNLLILAALAFYIWNRRQGNIRKNEAENSQNFSDPEDE